MLLTILTPVLSLTLTICASFEAGAARPPTCQRLFEPSKPSIADRFKSWVSGCRGKCETNANDGSLVFDSNTRHLRLVGDAQSLTVPEFPVVKDTRSAFKIRGVNATGLIRNVNSLNGIPLVQLQETLRPGKGPNQSEDGFIGRHESLLDLLASDNDFVRDLGFTHQEIARPLQTLIAAYGLATSARGKKQNGNAVLEKQGDNKNGDVFPGNTPRDLYGDGFVIEYKGQLFAVYVQAWMGFQMNILARPEDHATRMSSFDYVIEKVATGETIRVAGLLPTLIRDWGFYEGVGSPYRVSPQKIVDFFALEPKPVQ